MAAGKRSKKGGGNVYLAALAVTLLLLQSSLSAYAATSSSSASASVSSSGARSASSSMASDGTHTETSSISASGNTASTESSAGAGNGAVSASSNIVSGTESRPSEETEISEVTGNSIMEIAQGQDGTVGSGDLQGVIISEPLITVLPEYDNVTGIIIINDGEAEITGNIPEVTDVGGFLNILRYLRIAG